MVLDPPFYSRISDLHVDELTNSSKSLDHFFLISHVLRTSSLVLDSQFKLELSYFADRIKISLSLSYLFNNLLAANYQHRLLKNIFISFCRSPQNCDHGYLSGLGAQKLDTIFRHYYPESGFGWLILAVAIVIAIITHGFQLSAVMFLVPAQAIFKVTDVECLGKSCFKQFFNGPFSHNVVFFYHILKLRSSILSPCSLF